jgi:hypothetical protein
MVNAKYLRKRIALVAAAALGVGMIAAAPAFASAGTAPVISAPTAPYVAPGALATSSTVMSFAGVAATDLATLSAVVTTKPTGSIPSAVTFGTATGVTTNATFTSATGVLLQGTASNGSVAATVPLLFTPDMAGTYTITLTNTATTGVTQVWTVYAAGLAYQVGSSAATTPGTTGTGLAGPANTVTVFGTTNASGNRALVTVSGAGATITSGGTVAINGLSSVLTAGGTSVPIVIGTPTVGTVTVSEFYETGAVTGLYSATADKTVTITVTSTGSTAIFGASTSTAILGAGTATPTSDATVSVAKGSGTQVANIKLTLQNASGTAYTGSDVTASISGSGLIIGTTGSSTGVGTARVATVTLTGGVGYVDISGDGTAGVATITVSVGSTVFSTKTVTFTGPLATLAATNVTTINQIGANAGSVTVLAKDAAGNPLNGVNVFASSATPANVTVPATASVTNSSGVASFTVTGVAVGTSVLTFGELATSPTITTTDTVTVGSSTGTTVTLAFDKASYAPGEKAILTLTVSDANGKPVADATYTGLFTAALTSSVALGGDSLSLSASPALVGGVKTYSLFAPATVGAFSVNGTTGTAGLVVAAQGKAVTASATVTGSTSGGLSPADAAAIAAAIAAANAATAAVATLSKTIASLIASITAQIRALSALVKKLMKKRHIR